MDSVRTVEVMTCCREDLDVPPCCRAALLFASGAPGVASAAHFTVWSGALSRSAIALPDGRVLAAWGTLGGGAAFATRSP